MAKQTGNVHLFVHCYPGPGGLRGFVVRIAFDLMKRLHFATRATVRNGSRRETDSAAEGVQSIYCQLGVVFSTSKGGLLTVYRRMERERESYGLFGYTRYKESACFEENGEMDSDTNPFWYRWSLCWSVVGECLQKGPPMYAYAIFIQS